MKKNIVVLITLALMFIGCSKNSDSNSDNNWGNLKIDSSYFIPGKNNSVTNYVTTSFQSGINNGQANLRTFVMKVNPNNNSTEGKIQIDVKYPFNQSSINGIYPLFTTPNNLNNNAICTYEYGVISHYSNSGYLTVTDLGNNKFKLEFSSNCLLVDFQSTTFTSKTISGFYEGTFVVEN